MGYTHGKKWVKQLVQDEALKYKTRSEFQKNSPNAESAARRYGWLDDVCSHMPVIRKNEWKLEEIKEIASKYSKKIDFRVNENAAFLWAKRRKWIDDVCSHMKQNTHWKNKKNEVHQEALKYETRGEFCSKSERYYEIARRNKWLNEMCSHMYYVGNKFKRLVYVYEFDDNSVYVGLTFNDKKRSKSHKTQSSSPVYQHYLSTKLNPTKKLITDYIDYLDAMRIEGEIVEEYKKNGWNILNTSKTGGLGGNNLLWPKEKVIEIAKKYSTRSEFRKNEPLAWNAVSRNKWYNDVCGHMINQTKPSITIDEIKKEISKYTTIRELRYNSPNVYATLLRKNLKHLYSHLINFNKWMIMDNVRKEALKYKTRKDFCSKSQGAYHAAIRYGWLEDVCIHMIPKFRWTKEKIVELSKNYKYYKDFREANKIAYQIGKKFGWLNDTHLIKTNIQWNYESVKEEALKYKNRNEFCVKNSGAYQYALKNNILNEITTHMKILNVKGIKRDTKFECPYCGLKMGANLGRHIKAKHPL